MTESNPKVQNKAQDDELVMSLVELALARPPEDRERYLQSACAPDSQLFDEVRKYVRAEERLNGFLLDPLYPPPSIENPFEPGDLLDGRFRIVRQVAEGGMGIVYEAMDEKLERRIAIKCAKIGFRKRLPPEVRHATGIAHPNICKTFEIHEAATDHGEVEFLTMEFLEGETLTERLRRGRPPESEVRAIFRQLCAGLAEAHRNHIIHGDLKSNNVILTTGADGALRAVITDFGLARRPETTTQTIQSGTLGGTPDYMAPELWKGEPISPASDIYALGVILFQMVAGRLPYGPDVPWDERLHRRPVTRQPKWDGVLARCLDPDPSRRFRDGRELLEAMEPARRRSWLLVGAVAAVVAIATGSVTYYRATAAKESWRLALLPVESGPELRISAGTLSEEADLQLAKLSGGKTAALTIIPLSRVLTKHADSPERAQTLLQASHVVHALLRQEVTKLVLEVSLMDMRNRVNKSSRFEYTMREIRYAPIALAGFVTGALHLPPPTTNATVNPAAKQDYLAGLTAVHRDSGVDVALEHFQRAVAADPDSPLTYAGLAEAQWFKFFIGKDQSWLDRCTESLRQAELRNPDLAAVHRIKGILTENSGSYEQGEAEFQRAIELEPGDGDGYRRLGELYERTNRSAEALAAYRHAITVEPKYYRNYQALGSFFYRRGDYGEAARQFEQTVKVAPDESAAHFALGTAYMTTGRYNQAEHELQLAIHLGETASALANLAAVLLDEGKHEEAIEYIQRALDHYPEQYTYWLDLGIADELANRLPDSRRSFGRVLELSEKELARDPRQAVVRARLAYSCAKLGERARAESEIAQALQTAPDDAPTRHMAVRTYEALGQRENALAIVAASTDGLLADVRRSPDLTDLHRDSRFQKLLADHHIN